MPRMTERYRIGPRTRQRSRWDGRSGPGAGGSVILGPFRGTTGARGECDEPPRPAATTGGAQDMADERGRIFIDPAAYTDLDHWNAVAAELRAEGPLHWAELEGRDPFWVVLGLPEIMEIEKNSEVFTNAPDPVMNPKGRMTEERE